ELGVAADHVGGLGADAGHRVVDAAAGAGDLAAGGVQDAFLGVVHEHHAGLDPLADHRPGGHRAVGVVQLDPVVVLDADALGIGLGVPHDGPAARQHLYDQVVAVGGVDAAFLVGGDPVEQDFRVAGADRLVLGHPGRRLGVDGRAVDH